MICTHSRNKPILNFVNKENTEIPEEMQPKRHIVNCAIVMAAGKGERMHPLTLTTPKPLILVNGERMIDSVIHALHQNGIFEIYAVVGYLTEHLLNDP